MTLRRRARDYVFLLGEAGSGIESSLGAATDAHTLAADAVRLHEERALWAGCSDEAIRLRTALFGEAPLLRTIHEAIEDALLRRRERRRDDYFGSCTSVRARTEEP